MRCPGSALRYHATDNEADGLERHHRELPDKWKKNTHTHTHSSRRSVANLALAILD